MAMEFRSRILLITSDFRLLDICREALKASDFSIQLAGTVSEGIEKAEKEDFDIVFLDSKAVCGPGSMPELQKLWERDDEIACLLITKPDSLFQAFQSDFCDLLSFPTAPKHVLSISMIPQNLSLESRKLQVYGVRKAVSYLLEKRSYSLDLKRLQSFEKSIAPLWATATGEMETADLLEKDFLAPAAFRLTIAHEFRAPLTALQSFLLMILKGYAPPDQWNDMITHAYARSQELLNLVDDLMNLATASQEISAEDCCLVPLGEALDKSIPAFKAEAEQRGLTLTIPSRKNPSVLVNSSHVNHLWNNLISNAIKYTPRGGMIRISLEQDVGWAIGSVEDSGIGISPNEVPLIFHEFYRTAEAKRMEARGTGLGLPLVKRIVEGYGGTLEVKSAVGKGSLFRFLLPLGKPIEHPVCGHHPAAQAK